MHHLRRYKITNIDRSKIVCKNAARATRFTDRMRGLLGRKELSEGSGLLIEHCSGVHTWGMSFSIDIVAINRRNCVVGLWTSVPPRRVRGMSFKASRVLELAAGALAPTGTCIGDQLSIVQCEEWSNAPLP